MRNHRECTYTKVRSEKERESLEKQSYGEGNELQDENMEIGLMHTLKVILRQLGLGVHSHKIREDRSLLLRSFAHALSAGLRNPEILLFC